MQNINSKSKKHKIILKAAAVIMAVIAAAVLIWDIRAMNVLDENEGKHINAEEIENSTLIIGTHLIHISALSDSLYDIAIDTAEAYGQSNIYYKSELADGKWFEISDAAGIADIMSEGEAVEDSVIEDLFLRYHTKSDGITYDLLEEKPVCIFDTVSPYDLEELKEMDSVMLQYEMIDEKEDKTSTDKRNKELIEELLKEDLKEALGKEEADKAIEGLQSYYEQAAKKPDAPSDTALSVMESIDNSRRLDVYSYLSETMLPKLLEDIQKPDGTEGFYVDYDLISAVGTAIEESQKKQLECEAKKTDEGSSLVSEKKYDAIKEAEQYAAAGALENLEDLMETIEVLTNIENGTEKNPKEEAGLIKAKLIPELLNNIKEGDEVSSCLWETEHLAKTAAAAMSDADAEEFLGEITEKLNEIAETTGGNLSQEEIKAVNELKSSMEKEAGKYSLGESELAELTAKKEELKTERMAALDVNDMAKAEELGAELSEIEGQIEAEKNRLTDILGSESASDAEKAAAQNALKAGTESALIIEKKEEIQKAVSEGSYDSGLTGLEALEAMAEINPILAVNAMKDIYKDVLAEIHLNGKKDNDLNSMKEKLEAIISDNADNINQALIEDAMTGEGALGIIESESGESYENMDDLNKAAAAAALYDYAAQTGNAEVKNTALGLIAKLYAEDNPYAYEKLKNEMEEFISLKTFSECSDYRYVFDNANKSVTLSKDTAYRTYKVFSKDVITDSGKEEMEDYARYQSDIYIGRKYMEDTYGVNCMYIEGSEYAIMLNDKLEGSMAEFSEALYERTGL